MNCPKCKFDINKNEKRCLQCGEPIECIKKCIKISNTLYNKGLTLANNCEISNAIDVINKSVLYNKRNIYARNLLGLLYYKAGHYADAMKHWVISTNYDKEKSNLAFKYINKITKNIRDFEKGNDAIRLYNQAIRYLHKKNDDLAIIRIKNALKISPNFIDALNLLTFCYIIQGKNKIAFENAKKTLRIDINNQKATQYLKELNTSQSKDILDEEYVFYGKVSVDSNQNPKKIGKLALKSLYFIIPIVFMYFIHMKNYKDKILFENEQLKIQLEQNTSDYQKLQLEFSSLKNTKDENQQLKSNIIKLENEKLLIENKNKVEEVIYLIRLGKKKEAKNIFETIDISQFGTEDMERYNYAKERF